MKDGPTTIWGEAFLKVRQHLRYRSHTVDREDFAALFSAGVQDSLEHPLLCGEALVVPRPCIETYLPDVTRLFEKLLEQCQFCLPFGDQLRM